MKRFFFPVLLVMIICLEPASAESFSSAREGIDESGVSVSVDWIGKRLVIEISEKIPGSGKNTVSAAYSAERSIQSRLEDYFLTAFTDIPVNSRDTIGSLSVRDPALVENVREIARRSVKTSGRRSENFAYYSVVHTVPLYPDIMKLLVRHTKPYAPPRAIDYAPTTPYSGIVIYARGQLPVHGEAGTDGLVPCLLPRLYDENMNLLLTSEMVARETLISVGMATYSNKEDEESISSVAGTNPLYIMAEKLFGTRRTDILIPEEEAVKILSHPQNRQLLISGKILIICDLP